MMSNVAHFAWKSNGPVSVQKFLQIRPNSQVCLLAKHALVCENQLILAVGKAKRNFIQGVNRAREIDTELIRIISGTHNISLAFKRSGLTNECRTGWIVFLDEDMDAESVSKGILNQLDMEIDEHKYELNFENLKKLGIEADSGTEESKFEDIVLGHIAGSDLDY